MKLRHASASPFVRKVLVAAHEVGLAERIELVPTDVWAADTDIIKDNPLGKVPALVTDEGTFIGSALCCEYLDSIHSGSLLLPRDPQARWPVLRRHALADGVIEAAVAHIVETLRRPSSFVYSGTLARQREKIERTLNVIEFDAGSFDSIDLSSITLGCALGYLDFRHNTLNWRTDRPRLTRWYETFKERPSMQATAHVTTPIPTEAPTSRS